MALEVLIFDVDGTLANTERDGHLVAFNLAFKELGLDWKWSNELYHELLNVTGGQLRIKYYLKKYNTEFKHNDLDNFVASIHQLKTNIYVRLMNEGAVPLRPGVERLLNEAIKSGLRLAIATTTTPANVDALITNTLGKEALGWFEVIGAGNVVPNLKPAEDIYTYVLEQMNIDADKCLAFEDSYNGIISATNAGLTTLITVNEYTNAQKFDGACVVLNNLGEANKPFKMIEGGVTKSTFVDVAYLHELHTTYSIIKLANNSRVYDVVDTTPLTLAFQLSKRLANNVYLKREDELAIHSFKLRGAYQKISSLSVEQVAKGVVASSAGNHAQGVALSAQKLGIKAVIVMPLSTPKIKVNAVEQLGGKVILHGDVYDDAYKYAKQLEKQQDLVFIHPYDDIEVMSGQATISKELLEQLPNIDKIFIPVGGGGLIAGMATYIKHYAPNIKIIGVEPQDSSTLYEAFKQNKRVILPEVGRFADGVAVKQIGKKTFEIAKQVVDEVVLVSNDEICAAIKDIYEDVRAIAEPAGALATAGIKKYVAQHSLQGENLISIVSGANVNFDRLRYISERADIGEYNEAIIAVTIDEKPGSFLKFCQMLKQHSITEFNYRYGFENQARIFVGVSLNKGLSEKKQLINKLSKAFDVLDMSDNSIAKTHIRYMVGGRSNCDNEVLYRFEFPERPGALLNFLEKIGTNWNISLFHYRNHGADFGRVLIGLQAQDVANLEQNFDEIGYFYQNETNNKAYQYFL
jgi:threonine dehydratase